MPTTNRKPLEGLTVIDFTHVLSGPFCAMMLADPGASYDYFPERAGCSGDPDEIRRL